jgi:hypothetical protein
MKSDEVGRDIHVQVESEMKVFLILERGMGTWRMDTFFLYPRYNW